MRSRPGRARRLSNAGLARRAIPHRQSAARSPRRSAACRRSAFPVARTGFMLIVGALWTDPAGHAWPAHRARRLAWWSRCLKVQRTDAPSCRASVLDETSIGAITDAAGATVTGYSYTIGTGGSSVMRLLADHRAPRLIGRDAERIEAIWHELEFATHAATIGAITAIALAAIDTALLGPARPQARPAALAARRRRVGPLPALHHRRRLAAHRDRGAGRRRPGGQGQGLPRLQGQDRPPPRLRGFRAPVRGARGGRRRLRVIIDCDQGFTVERRSAAPGGFAASTSPGSRSRWPPTTSTATFGCRARPRPRSRSAKSLYSIRHFREYMQRAPARSCRWTSAESAASPPG